MHERIRLLLALLLVACGAKQTGESGELGGGGARPGLGSSGAPAGQGEPAPARGAALVQLSSATPAAAGKVCPSGAKFSFQIPEVGDPEEGLDEDTYLHHVVDGEAAASVKCSVVGEDSFAFSGQIRVLGKSLSIDNGQLSGGQGSAGSQRLLRRSRGLRAGKLRVVAELRRVFSR